MRKIKDTLTVILLLAFSAYAAASVVYMTYSLIFPDDCQALTVTDMAGKPMPKLQRWADNSSIKLLDDTIRIRRNCDQGDNGSYSGGNVICLSEMYPDTFFHEYWHYWDEQTNDTELRNDEIVTVESDPTADRIRTSFTRLYGKQRYAWTDTWRVKQCSRNNQDPTCNASLFEWFAEAAGICASRPARLWRYESKRLWGAAYYLPTNPRTWLSVCKMLRKELGS